MSVKTSSLIDKNKINEDIRLISCSNTDYISSCGNVYKDYGNNKFYKKKCAINKHNGYVYCSITQKNGKNKGMRVHRLVASEFVENNDPYNLTIVGHRDNIKSNNCHTNLYWTTTQENTKKAADDGLNEQPKGIDNYNSTPIMAVDLHGTIVGVYGSMRQCCRCIKNLDITYLLKILNKKGDYTPRNKKCKYIAISKEEYFSQPNHLKDVEFSENEKIKKQMRIFKAINTKTGESYISDNQKAFGKEHGIHQATISQCLRHDQTYNEWRFEVLEEIKYMDSSAHKKLASLSNHPVVENIFDGSIIKFNTIKELTDYFEFSGHGGISYYIETGNLIQSKWKVVGF